MRYITLQKAKEYKFCYKIADDLYQSDSFINGLEYLLQAHYRIKEPTNIQCGSPKYGKTIYQQKTPIGENIYPLQVLTNTNNQYVLKVDSDVYQVDNNNIIADISNIDITVLMGPVFILQLAKNKVFCLHASAFIIANTCYILMANSGTGKSTIARHIQQSNQGKRIADDIVPLKITDDKVTILVNFPQLKLKQNQQYTGVNICMKTILLFASLSEQTTKLKKISGFEGMKRLIKHTVATKLFAEIELQNHLEFCHKTSEQTDTYQLSYQHSDTSLKQLQGLLNDIS